MYKLPTHAVNLGNKNQGSPDIDRYVYIFKNQLPSSAPAQRGKTDTPNDLNINKLLLHIKTKEKNEQIPCPLP